MQIQLLKSKIHRAQVTAANLNYEGSLGIDSEFMNQSGIVPYEKILIGNITLGSRFETYAISTAAGYGSITLNGAVAYLGEVGDIIVIMSFVSSILKKLKAGNRA